MIHLADPAGVLTADEFDRLERFITDRCLCTGVETEWLRRVIVRDDGPSGYSGYWAIRFLERSELDYRFLQAVIVLNSYYLKTLGQLMRTLAHEFGHHWTLGYMISRLEMPFTSRAEIEYYRMRGLKPPDFAPDYSKGWYHCDKEVLAEDYKYLFSPLPKAHRMKYLVGNPSSEVQGYLWDIGTARARTWLEIQKDRHSILY